MKKGLNKTIKLDILIAIIIVIIILALIVVNPFKIKPKLAEKEPVTETVETEESFPDVNVKTAGGEPIVSECKTADRKSVLCCYENEVFKECDLEQNTDNRVFLKLNFRKILEGVTAEENICIHNYLKFSADQTESVITNCYSKEDLLFLREMILQGVATQQDVAKITVSDQTIWEYE
jgi:hypothetical protein